MLKDDHIRALSDAISELQPLSEVTSAPASMQFQYVGTLVDNTMTMLVGVANALDGGSRQIQFSEFDNWVSAMQAVHRSFFSTVIIAVEQGLKDYCVQEKVPVASHRLMKAEEIIKVAQLSSLQAKTIRQLGGKHPIFTDYLNSVLKAQNLAKNRQNVWLNFFAALSVIRNKVSHSDTTLSKTDIDKLNKGGFAVFVSRDSQLQVNSRSYKQVIEHILDFYREVSLS